MPDDIRTLSIEGEPTIRHLHLHDRTMEALAERVVFDLGAQTCTKSGIGVTTGR